MVTTALPQRPVRRGRGPRPHWTRSSRRSLRAARTRRSASLPSFVSYDRPMREAPGTKHLSALERLLAGARVRWLDPPGQVEVVAVDLRGAAAQTPAYRGSYRNMPQRMIFHSDEGSSDLDEGEGRWNLDTDDHLFGLAAEARHIQLPHCFHPYNDPLRASTIQDRDRKALLMSDRTRARGAR
jgi:hypothetical protein